MMPKYFSQNKVVEEGIEEDKHYSGRRFMGSRKQKYPRLPESNIGCQMLQKMGWRGGGLGRENNKGIEEPIMPVGVRGRQGLGMGTSTQSQLKLKRKHLESASGNNVEDFLNDCSMKVWVSNIVVGNDHTSLVNYCREKGLEYTTMGSVDKPYLIVRKPAYWQVMEPEIMSSTSFVVAPSSSMVIDVDKFYPDSPVKAVGKSQSKVSLRDSSAPEENRSPIIKRKKRKKHKTKKREKVVHLVESSSQEATSKQWHYDKSGVKQEKDNSDSKKTTYRKRRRQKSSRYEKYQAPWRNYTNNLFSKFVNSAETKLKVREKAAKIRLMLYRMADKSGMNFELLCRGEDKDIHITKRMR